MPEKCQGPKFKSNVQLFFFYYRGIKLLYFNVILEISSPAGKSPLKKKDKKDVNVLTYWQNPHSPPHPQCCVCSTVSCNRRVWTTKIMCIWILITYYMHVGMKTLKFEKQGRSDSLCFISGCQLFVKCVQSYWLTCNTSHIWQTTNVNSPTNGAAI